MNRREQREQRADCRGRVGIRFPTVAFAASCSKALVESHTARRSLAQLSHAPPLFFSCLFVPFVVV